MLSFFQCATLKRFFPIILKSQCPCIKVWSSRWMHWKFCGHIRGGALFEILKSLMTRLQREFWDPIYRVFIYFWATKWEVWPVTYFIMMRYHHWHPKPVELSYFTLELPDLVSQILTSGSSQVANGCFLVMVRQIWYNIGLRFQHMLCIFMAISFVSEFPRHTLEG